jgi:hypothetical protein
MAETPGRGVSVEELRKFVRSLPGTEQRDHASWTGFKVGGKGFGYLSEDGDVLMLKSTYEERAALLATDPDTYSEGFTSGQSAWVNIRLAGAARDELEELVAEAWYLTAPKRLTEDFDVTAVLS